MGSRLHTVTDSSGPPVAATVRLNAARPPALGLATTVCDTSPPLTVAGDYELLSLLGRGGTGVVYLARQRGLKRQVAYKVLTNLGGIDPEALARFRGEAETLARLQHPGIVQVFDSGTDDGSPFIAMEYVPGGSLADRLRARRPTPREAAVLIATVAAAVGHTHALGVIHRDLKPANILLGADGRPKVADFGLARDVGGGRGNHVTRTGVVAGTPAYMSPEQISGKRELTPAVDVWALGVMLYELLTGSVPFPGADPQQVLVGVLGQEAAFPREAQPRPPRDLETICLKCLQKESHRRYPSGKELAEDLSRFLEHRAILARPVGPVAKGARWCRRNPLAAGLAAAFTLTLTAATIVSLAFAERAGRERANAVAAAQAEADLRRQAEGAAGAEQKARREAEAMTAMLDSLLASIQPGRDALAGLREQMDRTAAALQADPGDPLVGARLLYTLALTRRKLGDFREAVPLMERALAIRTEHLGPDHALTRQTACETGYTYVHVNRCDDAVRVVRPVVEAELADLPADSPEALKPLQFLHVACHAAGRADEEEALGERMLAICVKHYGDDHEETEWARINLRRYSVAARRFSEAIPVLRKAYARFQATWGPDSGPFICARAELGRCLLENGQPDEALPYLKEMYDSSVARNGPTHPIALVDRQDLARGYEACGRFADAVPHRRELRDHFQTTGDANRADSQAELLARDLAALAK